MGEYMEERMQDLMEGSMRTEQDLYEEIDRLSNILPEIKPEVIQELSDRLAHARSEHPDNGGSYVGSLQAVKSEAKELMYAWNNETTERVKSEALDVAVTALRFLNKEYK